MSLRILCLPDFLPAVPLCWELLPPAPAYVCARCAVAQAREPGQVSFIDTKRALFKATGRGRLTKYGKVRREDAEKAEEGQCDASNQYQTAETTCENDTRRGPRSSWIESRDSSEPLQESERSHLHTAKQTQVRDGASDC